MPTKIYSNALNIANSDNIANYSNTDQIDVISYGDNDLRTTNPQSVDNYAIKNISGIFGIPYQFRYTEDPRINENKTDPNAGLGAKYAEKIIAKMPLLFLVPCKQKFMDGYDADSKGITLASIINGISGEGDDLLNSALSKNGRYYSTVYRWDDYYRYVNILCHTMATFMGINNIRVPTPHGGEKRIQNINWQYDFKDIKLFDLTQNPASRGALMIYVDGSSITELSESFSNTTTESSLASSINGYSDQVKEIRFLLGEGSGIENMMDQAAKSISDGIISNIGDAFSNLTGKMLTDLATNGTSTVLSGGKLIFPKIWQDSSFSRSYSFTIKLRSPDHDNVSIYFNIMVPYLHILALTLPVSHEDNVNAYNAPFLLKAYCKGLFNINDGIISDLSVSRGAECQWNDDGLPTQMDLSISIEDLYSSLFMSALKDFNPPILINTIKDSFSFVQNTAMMDYLANLAGLNIAEEDMARTAKMIIKLCNPYAAVVDAKNNVYNFLDRGIATMIKKLYF